MKCKIAIVLCLLIYLSSGVVMGSNSTVLPNGYLVFGEDGGLHKIDLKSCKREVLYKDEGMFNKISRIDKRSFLFYEYGKKEEGVKIFNMNTHTARIIYNDGSSPHYNSLFKKLFFFYAPSFKIGNGLYIADMNNPENTAKRITDTRHAVENLISVSASEVVFIRNDSGNSNNIYLYNISTNKLTQLPIQNCTLPTIWRSKTKQLMCFNRDEYQYFLTDLSGENRQAFKKGSNFLPVLYLPEYDALLYTVERFTSSDPEKGSLWIYDFATGRSKMLCDNIKLGTGDAAYYPTVNGT